MRAEPQGQSGKLITFGSGLIVVSALGFTTTHHPHSLERSTCLGDQGVLSLLMVVIIEIDQHPIMGLLELMGASRVGEHHCEVPA